MRASGLNCLGFEAQFQVPAPRADRSMFSSAGIAMTATATGVIQMSPSALVQVA
jgi:hypothetical protein